MTASYENAEAPADEALPEVEEFRPHRKWYTRPDVMVPLVLVVLGFSLLVGAVEEQDFFRTRMKGDPDLRFDWMYFFHMIPLMLKGLLVTAKATVLGFMVALVLGFIFALGRRSQRRLLSWPTAFVIEFIRSTPLLVQLVFLQAAVRATDLISAQPLTILTVGLGIHYATYCSEAYRAGINSVDQGQWEAATALNLGPATKWGRVIMPQAVPNVLPALGNFLVAGFKDAPLGVAINVHGLLFFADQVRATDFRAVEPYLLVGVGFLLVSIPAAWVVRRLEERIAYERV
jgi:polar amino acid transport system permease protein